MAKVEDPCACKTSSDVTNEKRDQGEARPASRRPAPAAGKIVCSRAFARELEAMDTGVTRCDGVRSARNLRDDAP